ncbi:unnamed protein product [Phyllotreta striolata]|uniref:Uncharacterized protein n=1 Tax=Phyllotreta striolata TaxID=444603 RepID=A0A9N9TNL3_PHYSR|nr:unnamed protein product [Phyllotreta striolata]
MFAKAWVVLAALLVTVHGGLLDEGGYGGAISSIGGSGIALAGKETVIERIAPPKYEYKYAVKDPHTGDLKEQSESRLDDLTKSQYSLAEKDRKISVSRIISKSIPLVAKGGYSSGY